MAYILSYGLDFIFYDGASWAPRWNGTHEQCRQFYKRISRMMHENGAVFVANTDIPYVDIGMYEIDAGNDGFDAAASGNYENFTFHKQLFSPFYAWRTWNAEEVEASGRNILKYYAGHQQFVVRWPLHFNGQMNEHVLKDFFTPWIQRRAVLTKPKSLSSELSTGGDDQGHIHTTDSGIRFGVWPDKPNVPAGTLVFFGGSVEEMLKDDYQRQCGNILAEEGYICVLVDGPCEGKELRPGEPGGLDGWRYRLDHGDNFVPEVNSRVSALLDYLIAQGYTDPERIVACGISRGGFLAMHFTISEPRVTCTAVYCPVVNLGTLQLWFKGAEHNPAVRSVDLMEHAAKLAGRPLWIVLGDQDRPIDTDYVIAFARKVSRSSGQNSQIELHVIAEPGGHTTPEGSDEKSAAWILKQIEKGICRP